MPVNTKEVDTENYEGPEGAVVTLSGPPISGMLPIYSIMACHSITPLGQLQAIHFITLFVHIS